MHSVGRPTRGLGRPLRDVLHHGHPVEARSPTAGSLFGENDARVESLLAKLRRALALAFPGDAVVSRHSMYGSPVTRITTTARQLTPPEAFAIMARRPEHPSLQSHLDLAGATTVSVQRIDVPTLYDKHERRLFAAIVRLVVP